MEVVHPRCSHPSLLISPATTSGLEPPGSRSTRMAERRRPERAFNPSSKNHRKGGHERRHDPSEWTCARTQDRWPRLIEHHAHPTTRSGRKGKGVGEVPGAEVHAQPPCALVRAPAINAVYTQGNDGVHAMSMQTDAAKAQGTDEATRCTRLTRRKVRDWPRRRVVLDWRR